MILMTIIFLVVLTALVATVFLLGFRVGDGSSATNLARVRSEAGEAQRRMHDLTRQAFLAMAEEAERQRPLKP